ncbi:unnamed protein product [Callosobruchus maculatus]|uniref:Uncharacterized protein n=1 Tax=Callosobruchus maculatus TaxID=64391 RepID=A0A653C5L1_CALMS|nr:unnamed protein product [Callosobruchus maculatus]
MFSGEYQWRVWLFLIKQWRDCFLANTSGVSGYF